MRVADDAPFEKLAASDRVQRSEFVLKAQPFCDKRWSGLQSTGRAPRAETGSGSMAESVYKVIELVGTSTESWDKAASAAVERAAETLRDLRVAEVVEQDITVKDGKVEFYRVKVKVSFKYENADD
jgi:dodecin